MIQPNELRAGNWVHESTVNIASAAWVLKEKQADGNLIKSIELGDIFYPIPISPEILTKSGFAKEGGDFKATFVFDLQSNYQLRWDSEYTYLSAGCKWGALDEQRWMHIKYIHQLQNLYFAWKGTELEIKF